MAWMKFSWISDSHSFFITLQREWRTDYETNKWNWKSEIQCCEMVQKRKMFSGIKKKSNCLALPNTTSHDSKRSKETFKACSSSPSHPPWQLFSLSSTMLNLSEKRKHVATISNEPWDAENLIGILNKSASLLPLEFSKLIKIINFLEKVRWDLSN